jgi:hypothetical protein
MLRGLLLVVSIALLAFGLYQFFDPYHFTADKERDNKEREICLGKDSFPYQVEGKRYALPFEVIGDQAVTEGDIVIGQAEDILKRGTNHVAPVPGFVLGRPKFWVNGEVPFVVDGSVSPSDRGLIRKATREWEGTTNIRFKDLSATGDGKPENYVKFSGQENFCSSNSVGIKQKQSDKTDEKNNINVVQVAGCHSWGQIAHEIGHVLGLGHEHTRSDRDYFITILWDNIQNPVQFCRATWRQPTLAKIPYDYDSIMHASVDQSAKQSADCQKVDYEGQQQCLAFVPNQKELPKQEPEQGTIEIGQRNHLSAGDIDGVNTLYPGSSPSPPTPLQPCVVTTTRTITVWDRRMTTTSTEPCPSGGSQVGIDHFCHSNWCRPIVRVGWPRPDGWSRPGWCNLRPRPICNRWIEDRWERPPFDDWDDGVVAH